MDLSGAVLWSGVHMTCEYWAHAVDGQSTVMNLWLLLPFILSMLVGKFEAHLEAELHKDIEAKAMQNRQSAGDALLAMFYDVVAELDHDRCIAAPKPKLGAFLLHPAPARLEHTPLDDLLLDEEDRDRLRRLLCPADGLAANSFVELSHARMQGGFGTVFEVELFGYRFFGHNGRQRYLVGIREADDFEKGGMPMVHTDPQPVATALLDEAVVVVDPSDDRFPILSHTPGFSSRIMPVVEGTCLLPAAIPPFPKLSSFPSELPAIPPFPKLSCPTSSASPPSTSATPGCSSGSSRGIDHIFEKFSTDISKISFGFNSEFACHIHSIIEETEEQIDQAYGSQDPPELMRDEALRSTSIDVSPDLESLESFEARITADCRCHRLPADSVLEPQCTSCRMYENDAFYDADGDLVRPRDLYATLWFAVRSWRRACHRFAVEPKIKHEDSRACQRTVRFDV